MALIAKNRDIAPMTTMGLHTVVDELIEFDSIEELEMLRQRGFTAGAVAIGGGSNMLFTSPRFNGRLIHSAMRTIEVLPDAGGVTVRADSGVTLDDLVAMSCAWGLWGLENLSLIPGQIGGATVQNVGAYGAELADSVTAVEIFDLDSGTRLTLSRDDMNFGYRHSRLKEGGEAERWFVTSVTFRLSTAPAPRLGYKALAEAVGGSGELTPQVMREAVTTMRRAKLPDPADTGSVGSYFKNPVVSAEEARAFTAANPDAPAFVQPDGSVKLSAAWLIDHAGCKPMRCGGAALWHKQPLVIVNLEGEATAADILELERQIVSRVSSRFGVDLQCEVVKSHK